MWSGGNKQFPLDALNKTIYASNAIGKATSSPQTMKLTQQLLNIMFIMLAKSSYVNHRKVHMRIQVISADEVYLVSTLSFRAAMSKSLLRHINIITCSIGGMF